MPSSRILQALFFVAKFGIFIIVYFLFIVTVSAVEYRFPNKNRELLEAELLKMIQDHRNGMTPNVDLGQIKFFSWDRVYIFPAYTNEDYIDEILGMTWMTSRYTGINSGEVELLVFTNHGRVVQYLVDNSGYFSRLSFRENGYSYGDARFIIDERSIYRHILMWDPKLNPYRTYAEN